MSGFVSFRGCDVVMSVTFSGYLTIEHVQGESDRLSFEFDDGCGSSGLRMNPRNTAKLSIPYNTRVRVKQVTLSYEYLEIEDGIGAQ